MNMQDETFSISLLNAPPASPEAHNVEKKELGALEQLFGYHKRWWCHRENFYSLKHKCLFWKALVLLLIACGAVIGPVIHDAVLVACLAAGLVGGWARFRNFDNKMAMARFAVTTYDKTLTELRTLARSGNNDLDAFLVKMQTLDDIVVDFTPVLSHALMERCDSLAVLEMCWKEENDGIRSYLVIIIKDSEAIIVCYECCIFYFFT